MVTHKIASIRVNNKSICGNDENDEGGETDEK